MTHEDRNACMVVAELRRALEAMPDDAPVVLEGCDCMGRARFVEPVDHHGLVVIRRYDGTNGYPASEAFPYETYTQKDCEGGQP